jgi:hypothetical protein
VIFVRTDTRDERLARRIADLSATDEQFAAAPPARPFLRRSINQGCDCRSFFGR